MKTIIKLLCILTALILTIGCSGCFVQTPQKLTIDKTLLSLDVGQSEQLHVTSPTTSTITWISSSEDIARVSDNGIVLALAEGNATVTAYDGTTMASCQVTVSPKKDIIPDDPAPIDPYKKDGFKLTFHDEFDSETLDLTKWGYQVGTQDYYQGAYGAAYWGNSELQYYTDGGNVSVSDGTLKITARKENAGDREYTSSRIVTRDNFSQTYGYFEARIKLPSGSGMWPAFWMMPQPTANNGTNNEYGGWAACGEIDIMENRGRVLDRIDTTIHYGGPWPNNKLTGSSVKLDTPVTEWHTYALEWTHEKISWFVDGNIVYTVSSDVYFSTASDSPSAPFDKPFYIILNLAVGGTYDPQGTQEFLQANNFVSATMEVDYVRAYQRLDYLSQHV